MNEDNDMGEDNDIMRTVNAFLGQYEVSRIEEWKMNMRLDYKGYQQFKKNIDDMVSVSPHIRECDDLEISYNLNVRYLGDVEAHMRTLIEIREAGYKLEINLSEMEHGRSLLAEILKHTDTIINSGEASP